MLSFLRTRYGLKPGDEGSYKFCMTKSGFIGAYLTASTYCSVHTRGIMDSLIIVLMKGY